MNTHAIIHRLFPPFFPLRSPTDIRAIVGAHRRHSRARRLVVARDSRSPSIDERRIYTKPVETVAERSSRGASYSAHDIIIMSAKELSALTGHGVDDCKTVLAECGGDVERAVDALLNSA